MRALGSVAILALVFLGCSTPPGADPEPRDGGASCVIQQVGRDLATSAGRDCGVFGLADNGRVPASDDPVRTGVSCALSTQETNHAFSLFVSLFGIDVGTTYAFVRTPSGESFKLSQAYSANGGGSRGTLRRIRCAAVAANFSAGQPGLECQSPQAETTLCN